MQFQSLFKPAADRPVSCALAGCGEFGLSLIAQCRAITGLNVVAVIDKDLDRVAARLEDMAVPARRVASAEEAAACAARGEIALAADIAHALHDGVEMLVEATGDAEWGARFAMAAIRSGTGVAMVSKEAECVVGPLLARKARAAGVPYTLIHGDQPALLIALISWCRMLGLPVVAAGKSSEYDYVYDPADHTVRWTDMHGPVGDLAGIWSLGEDTTATTLARRAEALAAFPQRTVPDFCEMALVANATGLKPDRADYHAPLTRAAELPFVYRPAADGGVLASEGILDVFNCLRRPDEASFAGGVFCVVRWADAASGALFRGKGIPTTADGQYGLVYNPAHLLGVEAPMSVMAAVRLGNVMVDETYAPVVDLTAVAAQDLKAGTELAIVGNRHAVPGLEARLTPARAVTSGAPLPYYMAVGRTLTRDVAKGEMLTADAVAAPEGSLLWSLRQEQDEAFAMA